MTAKNLRPTPGAMPGVTSKGEFEMKKLIILLILLVASSAHSFDLEYREGKAFYKSDGSGLSVLKAGKTHEIRIGHNDFFLFGSTEDFQLYGQWADIWGVGAGIRKDFTPFTVWLKVGYYLPEYDENIAWESGYYKQNKVWGYIHSTTRFKYYDLKLDSSLGAEMGVDFKHKVSPDVTIGLSASYRYLYLYESINGWNDGGASGKTGWICETNRDFGGFRTAVFINYQF